MGCNIEMVSFFDDFLCPVIQAGELADRLVFPRGINSRQQLVVSGLDIPRAVAEGLVDFQLYRILVKGCHPGSQAVSAPAVIFDAQQACLQTGGQVVVQGVTKNRAGEEVQGPRFADIGKTRPANGAVLAGDRV
jgi:hypothetical protein